jgi:hypothetical protein
MDRPSAEAVLSFQEQIEILKERVCPHLKYIGVAATKWKGGLNAERETLQNLQDVLRKRADGRSPDDDGVLSVLPEGTFVKQTVQMVENAEDGIAYLVMPPNDRVNVRQAIEALARFIAGRIGLKIPSFAAIDKGAGT